MAQEIKKLKVWNGFICKGLASMERANEASEIFVRFPMEEYQNVHLIFDSTLELFNEALSCYLIGAYVATAVMCRETIEAAIFGLLSSKDIKWDGERVREVAIDFSSLQDRLGKMLKVARRKNLIDEELEKEIREIKDKGDIGAHLQQRRHKVIKEHLEAPTEPMYLKLIEQDDARKTLHKTVDVIKRLIENVKLMDMENLQ